MPLLLDLADVARLSGLKVVELDGWHDNWSNGPEDYRGVGIHHTGSYDGITDADNDHDYARWMAFEGRSDLPAPLCNLALSAECVVYVCASGNANGMGTTQASGPMPYRSGDDGNGMYVVIEAMNSGTQGWGSVGEDADGNRVTQREAYHRLCAALCIGYGWPASHVRAHYETSVTGKWDPGDPDGVPFKGHRVMDMTAFRAAVARHITTLQEEDMPSAQEIAKAVVDEWESRTLTIRDGRGEKKTVTYKNALNRAANGPVVVRDQAGRIVDILNDLDEPGAGDDTPHA